MSLINDALKRAKEAQEHAPLPPAGPHLRPAEPVPFARHSLGLMVPIGLAVVALLGLFFVWRVFQQPAQSNSVEVRAQTPATANSSTGPDVQPGTVLSPASPAPSASPAVTNVTLDSSDVPTNSAPATEPAPPKPAPLKLQAIVYNPARPSAIISSKTVFIGDRVGEFHVIAITKESATLAGAGQTNVLSLGD